MAGSHAELVVLALHYQNDVLHPHGKIRVWRSRDPAPARRQRGAALT